MGLTQVSKDGVKNDAIDASKLPANSVGASELADNAVDTNAIADQAVALSKLPHGDGSSNGKFLRANNGADPSFESIPAGTTINNNADNRVITGDANANTLNGESNLTFNSSLLVSDGNGSVNVGGNYLLLKRSTGDTNYINAPQPDADLVISADRNILFHTVHTTDFNSTERVRIQEGGGISFNGDTAAANALDDFETGTWTPGLAFGGSYAATGLTYGARQGRYTKIGNIVYIKGYIIISNIGSSTGHARITGLPYASVGSPNSFTPLADRGTVDLGASGGAGSIGMAMYLAGNSAPYLYGYKFNGAGNFGVIQSSFTTNSEIDINIVYATS